MGDLLGSRVAALVLTSLVACAQESVSWRDPSKHQVQFVAVEDGVRLEVLDWGGTGRPVVLLAGYLTAHVYDDFAAKLSETCHVYGITRRGYGASSRPDSGYTAQRSADDVLQVLDSLKLTAPVLVGHSFGGQDLTTLGAGHPERIAGLVYLNSAEDPTLVFSDYGVEQVDSKKLPAAMRNPPPPDYKSFQAYRDWQMRTHGVAFPESELRNLFVSNPDGTMGRYMPPKNVRDAMFAGVQKPDYARIRVPVLAFFASPRSLEDQMQRYKPQDAAERAAMKQQYAIDLAIRKRHMRDLQSGVPAARVIELPGASPYIFLSNEADVLRELRAFVAGLH
ncbi:MAG: alpha/beta hydrolase [Acidobacteria bacterium]|nr:alpha/beta hydrolase [Acidobacteriota bacterium]